MEMERSLFPYNDPPKPVNSSGRNKGESGGWLSASERRIGKLWLLGEWGGAWRDNAKGRWDIISWELSHDLSHESRVESNERRECGLEWERGRVMVVLDDTE